MQFTARIDSTGVFVSSTDLRPVRLTAYAGGSAEVAKVVAQTKTAVGACTPTVQFAIIFDSAGVGTTSADLYPVSVGADVDGGGGDAGGGVAQTKTAVGVFTPAAQFAGLDGASVHGTGANLRPVRVRANAGGGGGGGGGHDTSYGISDLTQSELAVGECTPTVQFATIFGSAGVGTTSADLYPIRVRANAGGGGAVAKDVAQTKTAVGECTPTIDITISTDSTSVAITGTDLLDESQRLCCHCKGHHGIILPGC